jgi:shikimate 5-dehydrogenase
MPALAITDEEEGVMTGVNLDKESGVYDRQKELKLKVPKSAAIIGLGGVGSHVALDLALDGVGKLLLVDFDVVEESNRGRTMFTELQVGMLKTEAVCELIMERRRAELYPVEERVENISASLFEEYEVVLDCRDNSHPLPDSIMKKCKILGGYNGNKITIHLNPSGTKIWGEGQSSYTIIPSWAVPPQLISVIIRSYLLTNRPRTKEYIKHFDINNLLGSILGLEKEEANPS